MAISDRLLGLGLLTLSSTIFVYYTIWVIVTPFIEKGHFIHQYFLPREYAITIPITLLIIGLSFIFTFLSFVMIKSKK